MPSPTHRRTSAAQEPPASPSGRLRDLQAILFDLDGTLIDTVDLIRQSFRHATGTVLGRELPDEITMRNVGQPLEVQYRDMAPAHADELLRLHREFTMAHHEDLAREYPGTRETLAEIRRREIPMGIVTSKGTQAARHGIDMFGLGGFMKAVVTADDTECHKPDPCPLRFAADLMGVDLGYCIYVGDSPHDMQAAVAGGAIAVAALWGAFPEGDLLVNGPAFALRGIGDLLALIDGRADEYAVVRDAR